MMADPAVRVYHDMECRECDFGSEVEFAHHSEVRREVDCPKCGAKDQFRIIYEKTYGVDNHGGPESGYGQAWPNFGNRVVKSYSHKQQLLRETGQVEQADPVKGSRDIDYIEGWNGPGDFTPPKRDPLPSQESVREGWDLGAAIDSGTNDSLVYDAAQKAVREHYARNP